MSRQKYSSRYLTTVQLSLHEKGKKSIFKMQGVGFFKIFIFFTKSVYFGIFKTFGKISKNCKNLIKFLAQKIQEWDKKFKL